MRKILFTALAASVLLLAFPLQREPAQAIVMPPPPLTRIAVERPTILGLDEETVLVLGTAAVLTGGAALVYVAATWGTVAAVSTFALAVDYVGNAAFVAAVGQYGYERFNGPSQPAQ